MEALKSKRGLAGLCVALLLLAIVWYWASPRWTLYEMRSAAEAQDSDRLAGYIDFPAVRESMKEAIRAKAGVEIVKAKNESNPLGALGAAIGLGMVDGMVDAMVTPESMKAIFDAHADQSDKTPAGIKVGANSQIIRNGVNEFRLHDATKDGDLIFARYGFGWKLAGLRIPEDSNDSPTPRATECPAVGAC